MTKDLAGFTGRIITSAVSKTADLDGKSDCGNLPGLVSWVWYDGDMDWQDAKDVLAGLADGGRLGLVCDVDGTLSPIVGHPDQAAVTPRNRSLLAALRAALPLTAVLSGRSAEDVYHRIGIDGLVTIGNHGLERWQDGRAQALPAAAKYRPALERAIVDAGKKLLQGMLLEDKGVTFSVHYRQTERPGQVRTQMTPILQKIADGHGLRLTQGRMVFEFRPPVDVDKGMAFSSLVREYRLEAALYLGDDTTDIAALQAARSLRRSGECRGYGFAVVSAGTPGAVLDAADFSVQGVEGVESFLDWLLRACTASST
ncbi:MAG: trehalose-phosphatase [Chloroflexota bacterium]